jgi:hypothetical protein
MTVGNKKSNYLRTLLIKSLPLILSATTATAAKIQTSDTGSVHAIGVMGAITEGDSSTFSRVLESAMTKSRADKKPVMIFLDSGGGLVAEASRMAEDIKKSQPAVMVTKNGTCASACFLLYLTTPYKYAWHGARIGVHSVSVEGGVQNTGTKATTVDFARFAKANGAPDSVVGKLVTTAPDDIMFLSDNELRAMGTTFIDDENTDQRQKMPQPTDNGSQSTTGGDAQAQQVFEEQNRTFAKYWNEKLALSKAQHNGRVAYERRCAQNGCSDVIAYFDKKRRYVEAWKRDPKPDGTEKKLVCREDRYYGQLTCADWHDGHEFVISSTHRIGGDAYDDDDLLDIFK